MKPTRDELMIDSLLNEAQRLGAEDHALSELGTVLRADLYEGAKAAARYFGEAGFAAQDNIELRRFFLQSTIEKAFCRENAGVFSSPVIFPEVYGETASEAQKTIKPGASKKDRESRADRAARAKADAAADIQNEEAKAKRGNQSSSGGM